MTRYRMLAIDVDGTLVGPDQRVSPRNAQALRDAKRAGLTVSLCTGRSFVETQPVWQECSLPGQPDPMVVLGGAMVSESDTGRTLSIRPIDSSVSLAAARHLMLKGHCVTAVIDRWRWGFDCFLTDGPNRQNVWDRWFSKHPCTAREVADLDGVTHLPEILRLTIMVEPGRGLETEAEFRQQFGHQLEIVRIMAPNYGIEVLECFAHGVTKWLGISYIAQGLAVAAKNIAAIGDDINDIPMLKRAGLGVAMGNASPATLAAARHVAGPHHQDGLAEFIYQLLDGRFD